MSCQRRLVVATLGLALATLAAGPAFGQDLTPREKPRVSAAPISPPSSEEPRNFFLTHLLFDVLWVPTETGVHDIGLIGAHLAVANIGRVYIYGPPGVMLQRTDGAHGRAFQAAYTWGFTFSITDISLPGNHRATLFVNLAKCWAHGDYRTGTNVTGFSLAWK